MNTVIVPVDFSATSLNAARYAVKLLTGQYGVNIILYHMYEKSNKSVEAGQKLEKLKEELMNDGIVKIFTLAEEGTDFIDELEKLARHREADLIIMGITERSTIGQVFLGSDALKMVETKVCPVLIVPPDAVYREVKNVLLASDFKDAVKTTPSAPIKKILKAFHPVFHIINVDSKHYVALTEEYQAERAGLKEMFAEFNPEFYFLGWHDVDEAIHQFAGDKNVDLIIIIPREHSLLEKMFGGSSHTKKLAYQSNVPVLAVHE